MAYDSKQNAMACLTRASAEIGQAGRHLSDAGYTTQPEALLTWQQSVLKLRDSVAETTEPGGQAAKKRASKPTDQPSPIADPDNLVV